MTDSPFKQAARSLIGLGYNVLPIMAATAEHPSAGKMPGDFRGGRWWGMSNWQRFRDRAPTEFQLGVFERNYVDANIGLVLGSPIGS